MTEKWFPTTHPEGVTSPNQMNQPRRIPLNRYFLLSLIGLLLMFPLTAEANEASRLVLRDGDRVVLLGDSLLEQEQYFGWVEVMMTAAFPEADVSFRNLGWSADTPAGASRFGLSRLQAGREPANEGWKQLQAQLELTKPTVIVFGYGMASSLESGKAGREQFVADYGRLIETTRQISPQVRMVFLSPLQRLEAHHPHAQVLKQYAAAIEKLAKQHGGAYVDLFPVAQSQELRKDPIHLNGEGYRALAQAIEQTLQLPESGWQTSPHAETLRQVILRKNRWWFHRSRPANMAYVFGFRKHEQGQNADEIPKFDNLVLQEEQEIARLRSLAGAEPTKREPQLQSQYAKFTPQPHPEFTIADEFEVTLWAENPLLRKPIQMNFDPQGRLWVASSEAYPMIEVGQANPDKIIVLEDTDQDGQADKSTVFADDLLIPTGVEPGNGGVYVAQSTDLLFLKDTDRDGKADLRQRVLSGFGTEDTHHNLHTLTWGPDGRLYMNQSIYTRSDLETPRGVVRLKAGGGFRYQPNTMRMQIVFQGLFNSWGHQFSDYGQSFLTDGAGFQGIAYTFPGAKFRPTPGARRELQLISPGNYPKFCSMEIISGPTFPESWQGSIVTCDFRANRVTRFSLIDQGAGFVTQQEDDLLRTAASTFRPIDVKQGPDGALYIADWSNPIINHGEVDFRDPRRDRWHGRIWRITWKGAKQRPITDLTKQSTRELLDGLTSEDRFTREQSRRVLIERGQSTLEALPIWLDQQDAFGKLQGLWLHQALNQPTQKLLQELLDCEEPRIRAAAVRVLSDWADPHTDLAEPMDARAALALYQQRVQDAHPRVRLEVVRGLAKLGTSQAAEIALEALAHPMDRFLDYGLWLTVNELADPLMQSLENGNWQPSGELGSRKLEFVMQAIPPGRASAYLAERLRQNPIPKDGSGPWIDLIGKAGGRQELQMLYQQALGGNFSAQATQKALTALVDAQRLRKLRPLKTEGITTFLNSEQHGVQVAGIRLTGVWKLGGQVTTLSKLAAASQEPNSVRLAAIEALREIGNKPTQTSLNNLTGKEFPKDIRKAAVLSLARLNANQAAQPFFVLLANADTQEEALELWRGILSQRGSQRALASRIPAGISELAAQAGIQAVKETGREGQELLAALAPYAGQMIKPAEITPAQIKQLVEKTAQRGNPHRGEFVYRRDKLGCVRCHAIGGVGGKVGPDLTSIGASAPADYIVESLFKPNAKIKEGYHSLVVITLDGKVVTGIQVQNSGEELVLRDAKNNLIRIPQDDIDEKENGLSLMPANLLNPVTEQDRLDLMSFLMQLGRPGDFDASQKGVARAFEVFAGTHRVEQAGVDDVISGKRKRGWSNLLTLVNGNVPMDVLKEMTKQPINISLVNVYLRTQVEVPQDKQVTFTVQGAQSPKLWVDGQQVTGEQEFTTELSAGKHTVLLRIDGRQFPETLRLESKDVRFLAE